MNVVPFAPKATLLLFVKLLLSLKTQKHTPDTTNKILQEYDYIIVGAGSGGATLAARLSEKPCVSVLLLEAGRSPPLLTEVPLLGRGFIKTDIDWGYKTVPQKYTGDGLINRQVYFPSGKAVGGSSTLNAMVYVRGAREIYDKWAAGGATGWSYKEVLPYFKKSEMNEDTGSIDAPYHGFKGPMTIARRITDDPYRLALHAAVYELGHEPVDVNGRYSKGFYDYQANLRRGQRCSTAKAYLVPAENRTNLYIVKNAFVTKILIENRRAIGVQFDYAGRMYVIRAKKEVIVSAGAVNTPQLLMLSGIGPKRHLQEMDIPVIADLPVGQNLQDHPTAAQYYYTESMPPLLQKATNPASIASYIANRTGTLVAPEGIQYVMFWTNEQNSPPDAIPDYELYFLDGLPLIARTQINIKPEVYQAVFGPYEFKSQLWCLSQNLHSKSRGTIKLRSANPYHSPLIDPNYFSDPQDLTDVVEGMKACDRIINTNSMRSLGVKPFATVAPGCEPYLGNQDEYLACSVRLGILTISHQCCTTKMGDPHDPTTVLDPELRVKTINGLRVVDASVMPLITNGNTNNPTIMIAEKAADIIKRDIRCGHDDDDSFFTTANDDHWWDEATKKIHLPNI